MTQPTPPLLGYNNNVRYRGRTFHIQTEDSGAKYARIITHLFVDGGRIVKSTRSEYADLLGTADRAEVVRRMMKEQHKAMFLSLRMGEFDDAIKKIVGVAELTETPLPSSLDLEPQSVRLDALNSVAPVTREAFVAQGPRPAAASLLSTTPEPGEVAESIPVGQSPVSDRPSATGKPRKSRSSIPAAPRRARVVDDPTPIEFLPPTAPANAGRSSERLQRVPQALPNAAQPGVQEPGNQSIFGGTGEGRQTLDEVILSFLEEEES